MFKIIVEVVCIFGFSLVIEGKCFKVGEIDNVGMLDGFGGNVIIV